MPSKASGPRMTMLRVSIAVPTQLPPPPPPPTAAAHRATTLVSRHRAVSRLGRVQSSQRHLEHEEQTILEELRRAVEALDRPAIVAALRDVNFACIAGSELIDEAQRLAYQVDEWEFAAMRLHKQGGRHAPRG